MGKPFISLKSMQLGISNDAQVVMNNFFLRGSWEGRAPTRNFSKVLELFETSRARKLIFGLHVNIDKASSRRYDVSRYPVDGI